MDEWMPPAPPDVPVCPMSDAQTAEGMTSHQSPLTLGEDGGIFSRERRRKMPGKHTRTTMLPANVRFS